MAALNPVHNNFQSGTIGSSMASSATTINLGAVPGFPSLVAANGDFIPISMIDGTNITNSEILYMTGYTAGNSTGQVLRAQETNLKGGSAQSWAASASWQHSPTAFDINAHPNVIFGGNTSGTMTTVSSGSIRFDGGNNITLSGVTGTGGATVTISAGGGGGAAVGVSTGGNSVGTSGTISSGSMIFAGGNNVTLSQATGAGGNTMTISAAAQTAQTVGIYGSNNTSGTSTGTADARSLTFQAQGNLSVDMTNGRVNLSVPAQTAQTIGIYGSSNTSGTSTGTLDARSMTFQFAGNISGNMTNGRVNISVPNMISVNGTSATGVSISGGANVTVGNNASTITISAAAQTAQTQSNIQGIVPLGNTSGTTGTISTGTWGIAGGNNITLSQSSGTNSSNITISGPNMISVNGTSATGVSISGGANVTVGNNASTITISVLSQSNQTLGIYGSSNTSGTSSGTADARSLTFIARGNLSVDMTNGQVVLSVPAGAGGMAAGISTGGNTSNTSVTISTGTMVLAGGNNVTLSQVTNAGGNTITLSGPNMISVNGTSGTGVSISGGNGITVGNNASTITISAANQTNQTIGIYGSSNTSGTSTGTLDARSMTFQAFGGVSVDMTNGRVNISGITSAAQTNQTLSYAVTGNTTGNTSGLSVDARSLTLQGLGIISAGLSTSAGGSSIIVSATQSIQTQNLMTVNGTQGNVTISGGANVTVGNNASTITISAAAQTNQTIGLYGSSNTSGTSTGTVDARSLSFLAKGNLTVDMTNGIVNLSAGGGGVNIAASNTTYTSGTVVLSGGANVTVGTNAQTVTISAAAQTNQTIGIYGSSNTSGTSTGTLDARSMTFLARGGVSVDMTNGVVNISGITSTPQTVQTIGIYGSSNTSGTSTGTLDARSMTFLAKGGVSVDMTNGLVNISGITQTNQTSLIQALVPVGNTTGTTASIQTGSIGISGGNNITISQSSGTNSTNLVISALNMFSAGISNGLGNTDGTNGMGNSFAVIVGGNNITVSQSKFFNAITMSVAGPNMISVNGTSATGVSVSGGNNITVGNNASTITISGPTMFSAGVSTGGNTSNTTGLNSKALVLAGGNNVTLSQVTDANGATITISAPNLGGGAGLNAGISTQGNTSGTTGLVASSLLFVGGNNVTLSQSVNGQSATLTISAASDAPIGVSNLGNTQGSTGVTQNTGQIVFVGTNNITLNQSTDTGGVATISISGNSIGVSRFGISGNTTNSLGAPFNQSNGAFILAGGNNITISQDISGAGSTQSIIYTISGPNAIGADFYEPMPFYNGLSGSASMGYGSWYMQPLWMEANISSGRINMLLTLGGTSASLFPASTATSFATGTTGGASQSFVLQHGMALYSRGAGANSSRWESYWSNTYAMSYSQSIGVSLTNASQLTIQHQVALVYPSQVDTAGAYTLATISRTHNQSFANSSTGTSNVTSGLTAVYNIMSGGVMMPHGFNTSASAGFYLFGHNFTTAQTTGGSSLPVAHTVLSVFGLSTPNESLRPIGVSTTGSTSQYLVGQGIYNTTSAAAPATMVASDIRINGGNLSHYMNYMKSSLS